MPISKLNWFLRDCKLFRYFEESGSRVYIYFRKYSYNRNKLFSGSLLPLNAHYHPPMLSCLYSLSLNHLESCCSNILIILFFPHLFLPLLFLLFFLFWTSFILNYLKWLIVLKIPISSKGFSTIPEIILEILPFSILY